VLPCSGLLMSIVSGGVTEYQVALLPHRGVGQQANGTRLSTRGRARGGAANSPEFRANWKPELSIF
jgi:hypothetical protein